jgi:hypothetical protein
MAMARLSVVAVGLAVLFAAAPVATTADAKKPPAKPRLEKHVQAAAAQFRKQGEPTPPGERIEAGDILFKDFFGPRLSARGKFGQLVFDLYSDTRIEWKEVVGLLGRPDSLYEVPIESRSAYLDRKEDIAAALRKKELPFSQTAFLYRLGESSVGSHGLLLLFEGGALRTVKRTLSTR